MKYTLSKKIIIQKYITQYKSLNQVAKELGCSSAVIRKHLIKYNITIRPANYINQLLLQNKKNIINLYNDNYHIKYIAKKYKCSTTSIISNLKKWGIDTSKHLFIFKKNKNYIIEEFKNGKSVTQISKNLNCDLWKLSLYLRQWGFNPRDNYQINYTAEKNSGWTGYGEISGAKWSWICSSAKTRNLKIYITIKEAWELFLKQNRKCAISGRELTLPKSKKDRKFANASLDRIDSNKDYTLDNIQWVDKTINKLKGNLSDKEFINLCQEVLEYQTHVRNNRKIITGK